MTTAPLLPHSPRPLSTSVATSSLLPRPHHPPPSSSSSASLSVTRQDPLYSPLQRARPKRGHDLYPLRILSSANSRERGSHRGKRGHTWAATTPLPPPLRLHDSLPARPHTHISHTHLYPYAPTSPHAHPHSPSPPSCSPASLAPPIAFPQTRNTQVNVNF